MSRRPTRGAIALLGAMLVIALAVAVPRCSDADARPAAAPATADRFPVLIVRHTYDGTVMHEGTILDFAWSPDGAYVETIDGGDGIFRSAFELPP